MNKLSIALVLVLLFTSPARGQSVSQIDNIIEHYLNNINNWATDTTDARADSLDAANTRLLAYLTSVPAARHALLQTDFKKAKKSGLDFVTSSDGKIRFYSWDTYFGGTMHMFYNVAQFKDYAGVHTIFLNDTAVDGGDYAGFYTGIITIADRAGKAVYIVTRYSIGSTKDRGEEITAYTIYNGLLLRQPIFKTTTKLLDHIEYGYDSFAAEFPDDKYPKTHFSKDNKTLYIPIVIGEKLTNCYLVYKFDGNNYVFDKKAK